MSRNISVHSNAKIRRRKGGLYRRIWWIKYRLLLLFSTVSNLTRSLSVATKWYSCYYCCYIRMLQNSSCVYVGLLRLDRTFTCYIALFFLLKSLARNRFNFLPCLLNFLESRIFQSHILGKVAVFSLEKVPGGQSFSASLYCRLSMTSNERL